MIEPLPKWLSVQQHTYFNKHSFLVPIRKATFIFKTSTFLFIIQKNDGFFLRCQDTISVPKIRGMQFRTLHVLPLYRIYIIETNTLLFMHLWCKTFYYICYSNRKVRQNVSVILPHSSLFFPIRNHICTLIKIVLRFQ